MAQDRKCPECGANLDADAPEGLCPGCLMKQGLGTEPDATETRPSSGEGLVGDELLAVKTVEETAGRYTQMGEHAKGGMGRVLIVHDEHR